MVALVLGLCLLALGAFALRMLWIRTGELLRIAEHRSREALNLLAERTAPHFSSPEALSEWMTKHNVDRVVMRHGQLTVAERTPPIPEPQVETTPSEGLDDPPTDEVSRAFATFARPRKRAS
jgi:hypothetical protein